MKVIVMNLIPRILRNKQDNNVNKGLVILLRRGHYLICVVSKHRKKNAFNIQMI